MTVAMIGKILVLLIGKLPYRYIAHYKNGQWDQG